MLTPASFNPELLTRINLMVEVCQRLTAENFAQQGFTQPQPKFEAEFLSDKWCKITRDRSAYAFVCLKDNVTKVLGAVKVGDIHKPASWKAPSKHSRGSVFADDFGGCLGPYGVSYLR